MAAPARYFEAEYEVSLYDVFAFRIRLTALSGCHTAEQATANNVLLEALACGTPIVADRVGGIPEYVTDGCGFLSGPGDAAALADSIEQLARSPALRHSMGAAARRRAEELAWPKVAARTLDIYRLLA